MTRMHPEAARIAADVAARYGAIVSPDVVRVVPSGTSGLPLPVWDGHNLVMPEGTKNLWKQRTDQHFLRAARVPKPHIQVRRDRLAALHASGMADSQIAAALGVSMSMVYADRCALGLECNRVTGAVVQNAKHLKIRDMVQAGMRLEDIAAAVNLTPGTVQDVALHKFGLSVRATSSRDLRRDRLRQMIAAGASFDDMLGAVDVGRESLRTDLAAVGYVWPPKCVARIKVGGKRWRAQRAIARRARVAALLAQGMDREQIKAALGLSEIMMRSDMFYVRRSCALDAQRVAA